MTPRTCNDDFRCHHCGAYILAAHAVSGVNNRNHCPYCLWSCHLDLFTAGDRLSACKAPMRPLGLTVKPGRNKYAADSGELMLVHMCEECGRVSINRIAADDDAEALWEVFCASDRLSDAIRPLLFLSGIGLLQGEDEGLLRKQILGEVAVCVA
jgi:hypothetical protein